MLAIGGDHAAFSFKEEIKEYLDEKGIAYMILVVILQKAPITLYMERK